jgi:hypothetical protein
MIHYLDTEQTGAFYQSLGPLKLFQLIEKASDEKQRTYRCSFGETRWVQRFTQGDDGEIVGLDVEPET